MRIMTTAALLIAALGLTACSNPSRLGGGGFGGDGAGIDGGPGSVSDPTSIAYFNERVGDRVLFEVDETTLSNDDRAILDAQADWLLRNTQYTAIVEGHADERGTQEYNMGLSEKRANAVRAYLITQGVPANRVGSNFFGKLRPIAVCSEDSCYAQNRRSVTVIRAAPGT